MNYIVGQTQGLRLFTLVVEHRGISKAADRLNIAKSAVSRRLYLMEDRYAAKLIDRALGRWSNFDASAIVSSRSKAIEFAKN
jgi:hypothetical protein